MDCVGYIVDPEVPQELSEAATCATAFFRVSTSLDQLEGAEAVRKHTLFTTNRGHLVEVEGGTVLRSVPSPKDVTKIVVHHDFDLPQLYVVLLCGSGKVVLLAYHDFKVLHEWGETQDIVSADPEATGCPQLVLTKAGGNSVIVCNAKLMSFVQGGDSRKAKEEDSAGGKSEAVQALMRMLKGGIKHAEQLRNDRKTKENFITEELATLQARLQGQHDDREDSLVAALTIEDKEVQRGVVSDLPHAPLRIQRVYHTLVHDKWVVMVNVINQDEQVLVSQLELILSCSEGLLYHASQVLKSVKHSVLQPHGEVRATIDHLDPPILRPKKRACVVGVCEVPPFESGPSISCFGLLSYTCKPLKVAPTQSLISERECPIQEYQVSVPLMKIKASELHCHMASLQHCTSNQTAGVSFSTVALVAASCCTQTSLTSLVSPLSSFITKISQHHKLIKMSGVSDFYVLYPGDIHPLQHTGFTLHHVDSHNLNLDLYTKDKKQALVLAHSLLAALPEDTRLHFLEDQKVASSSASQPLNLQHILLARMRDAVTLVVDGLEAQLSSNKTPRIDREEGVKEQEDVSAKCMREREELTVRKGDMTSRGEHAEDGPEAQLGSNRASRSDMEERMKEQEDDSAKYKREREELMARKGDITFRGEEYSVWRKKLQSVQAEVDSLYFKYLKLNCTSD